LFDDVTNDEQGNGFVVRNPGGQNVSSGIGSLESDVFARTRLLEPIGFQNSDNFILVEGPQTRHD